MRGIDGVADPAFDFGAEDERVQEVAAGNGLLFGEREDRRRHGTGRMDDGLEVRVVEVEHVRAHAVQKRHGERIHPFAPADHRGLGRAGKRGERGNRVVESLVTRAAKRAAHPVDDGAPRLAHDRRRDVFGTSTDNVARELTGDVGRGVGHPRRLRGRSHRYRRDASRGEGGHERSPMQTGHGQSLLVIQTGWECDTWLTC